MERTSGEEYFNKTIVSKGTTPWKRKSLLQLKSAKKKGRPKRDGFMGAIRTEETADNSLINGDAYSVIHC